MNEFLADFGAANETEIAVLPRLSKKKVISGSDIAALRKADLAVGLVSRQQAEQMFAIERSAARKCRAWGDLLVEVLLDFVVWGERPTGVLTDEAAAWLIDQIGPEPTPACLALLVAILEEASTVPAGFHLLVRDRATRAFAGSAALSAAA